MRWFKKARLKGFLLVGTYNLDTSGCFPTDVVANVADLERYYITLLRGEPRSETLKWSRK